MRANTMLALAAILGGQGVPLPMFGRRTISDELGIDLETEYHLIQAKKSRLSRRDRERVVYTYEARLRTSGAQGKEGAT